jgi:hypothetical protein
MILNGYRMNAMKERRNYNEKNIKSAGPHTSAVLPIACCG